MSVFARVHLPSLAGPAGWLNSEPPGLRRGRLGVLIGVLGVPFWRSDRWTRRQANGRGSTRANQRVRTTTRPPAVQLPVEGRMPSLDGATGWLNLPPLT